MRKVCALLAPLLAASCTLGPNFRPPDPSVPARWGATDADVGSRTVASDADVSWWLAFDDPTLASLVGRLVRQNLDVRIAAERVEQARAARRIAGSQGLPQVDATARYDRIRTSKNGVISLVEPSEKGKKTPEFNLWDLGGRASWELDVFGRVRRQVEAAQAGVQAKIEDRRGVALSAMAELATDYMQLRLAQAQERLYREEVAALEGRARLMRDRYRTGAASALDVAQADARVAQAAQAVPPTVERGKRFANAIALLLAAEPRALDAELERTRGAQPPVPPAVPVGLPSDLARRRPDVRRAEALLHAATAETGVAVAEFFPSIDLTGTASFDSLSLGSLFAAMSRMFVAGGTVTLPVFQGGRLTGRLAFARAGQREAALTYGKTLLTALHEVDDALTAYAQAQVARRDAAATVAADAEVLRLALDRYRAGAVDYLDVASAQDADLTAKARLAQADADVETSLVDLYKALGGGWQIVPAVGTASPDGGRLRLREAPLTWTGPIGGGTVAPAEKGVGRSAPNQQTGPERGTAPDRTTTGTERGDGE